MCLAYNRQSGLLEAGIHSKARHHRFRHCRLWPKCWHQGFRRIAAVCLIKLEERYV
jgi:hypothetical protein